MPWNWQHKKWPNFDYNLDLIEEFERSFLKKSGELIGSIKHLNDEDTDSVKVTLLSEEAFQTSKIEGELLERDSLHSSIRKHFGLKTDNRRVGPAERGISEMMVNLYQNCASPLDHDQLFDWHRMLMNGRSDLDDFGTYRTHEDPMQIISGPIEFPTVHFEAPPSIRVNDEMEQFVKWFNDSENTLGHSHPLVRAGIAHIYFESIHPFEDGNGRIGRALSEKSLSQNIGQPTLIALSHTIEQNKKSYYEALHRASIDIDITEWLVYFSNITLEAIHYSQSTIELLVEKSKFFHQFQGKLNERQHKVVLRLFAVGIGGFIGGLSAENYIAITRTTASTATRDLQKLVEMGAFKRTGERKGTRYSLNIDHNHASFK
ncbi:Fic family protein [Phaeocystidibacter luteus]|uniref:Fic family protein n=1 Tax=Phaeocystidibacter luteus TaxID=911197 RepID=A0A6N6RFW8_9FLAO|nr:Fic family protein [Phaeocystidibacter luteus]KAB2808658.1 Fic family protein [Phaeocystidibacter luteus]